MQAEPRSTTARRWWLAAAGTLAVLPMLALSAAPASAESIMVEPGQATAGSTVVVKGDLIGCYETGPGPYSATWGLPDKIDFYWDPTPLPLPEGKDPNDVGGLEQVGTWTKDDPGINISVAVPGDAKIGQHRIVAKLQPKCNYQGLDAGGKVVKLTDEPSYMTAVVCVVKELGGPCVDWGASTDVTGGSGGQGGGGNTGVVILVVGGVVTVVIGGLVVRGARRQPPPVEGLPAPCQALGAALHTAVANVTTLRAIDRELGDEIARRTQIQKRNLIKAALGSLVETTVIVAGGVSEVAAARKAALAARGGLGVMEHWHPPLELSPKLQAALASYERALARLGTLVEDTSRRLRELNQSVLSRMEAHPAVVRARAAVAELEGPIRNAEAAVQRRLGPDPLKTPRARYERAEGLLNGIERGTFDLVGQSTQLEDQIMSARNELRNLVKFAEANKQPLEGWITEYVELQERLGHWPTGGAGTTMSPGFAELLDRKKELEALAGKWDLPKALELRSRIDTATAAKAAIDAKIKDHATRVAKIMEDHERALIDLQNLEAAEAGLRQWQARKAAAEAELEAAKQVANDAVDAERRAIVKELHALEERERDLQRGQDELRRLADAQRELSPGAQTAAAHGPSAEQRVSLARQGLTIAGEILVGVETQSAEEVGRIIREGQEYLRVTAVRRKAVQRALEAERSRVATLREAVRQCVASQVPTPPPAVEEGTR